jgi:hypothetical protein
MFALEIIFPKRRNHWGLLLKQKKKKKKMKNFWPNGYKIFADVVSKIAWTPNYPKEGILFSDLTGAFNNENIHKLAQIVTSALYIEKKQVFVGIPSRGVQLASIFAATVPGASCVSLFKDGVGTTLPGKPNHPQKGYKFFYYL